VKPQPSANNPKVVGGAGIQWFYITNHHPELPKPSGKQPKHRPWWNTEPTMQEGIQLPELVTKIKTLREAGLRA
jgi:hypothetical protein